MKLAINQGEATGNGWALDVNGTAPTLISGVFKPLDHPYAAFLGTLEEYACFAFPPDRLRNGVNEFRVRHTAGTQHTLEYLDVVVI